MTINFYVTNCNDRYRFQVIRFVIQKNSIQRFSLQYILSLKLRRA